MVGDEAGPLTWMLRALVTLLDAPSVTLTVKLLVPVPVEIPEIAPPLESVNPPGRLPAMTDQEYGVAPPVAVSVVL